jgi:hypothetical protein
VPAAIQRQLKCIVDKAVVNKAKGNGSTRATNADADAGAGAGVPVEACWHAVNDARLRLGASIGGIPGCGKARLSEGYSEWVLKEWGPSSGAQKGSGTAPTPANIGTGGLGANTNAGVLSAGLQRSVHVPRMGVVDVAEMLRGRVLHIHGESTARQLADSFLHELFLRGHTDVPEYVKPTRQWDTDELYIARYHEWYLPPFNLTLRFSRKYTICGPTFRYLHHSGGGQPAAVTIALFGSHYQYSYPRPNPELQTALHWLQHSIKSWESYGGRAGVVLEHLGQHFDNYRNNGTGARNLYCTPAACKDNTGNGHCAPVRGQGNTWRHKAFESVFTHTNSAAYVPTDDLFRSKWTMHANDDCTHFCWFSELWQPIWNRIALQILMHDAVEGTSASSNSNSSGQAKQQRREFTAVPGAMEAIGPLYLHQNKPPAQPLDFTTPVWN